ncbi:MAG: DUF29 family protein, partial [Cyanobacteriota bacterium]|nr:DUF29 family protein [Cyanobacteriota bacterium]
LTILALLPILAILTILDILTILTILAILTKLAILTCYQKARLKASEETGIKLNFFPKESPFTLEETLTSSF